MTPEVWETFPAAAQALITVLLADRTAERLARVALEGRVRELEARLGQTSANSSRPPSSDPPWTLRAKRRPPTGPSGRRPGGQPGHPGHFRALLPLERVDAVVDHWPTRCGHCAAALAPGTTAGTAGADGTDYVPHQVTELPVVRATVTEHRRHRLDCATCGATTLATLPPEVPAGRFGPRLQATAATLSGAYRLSRQQVGEVCTALLDAPLSVGSVDALCQATSAALAAPVEAAVATLPQAPFIHADETPWKQGKARPWLWVAVSALVTVFRIAPGRDAGVIKALIGEDYRGTLITDRHSGYAWLDVAFRQVCWSHLIRDFQELVDRGGPSAPLGRDALTLTHQLFHEWHRFRAGQLDRAGLQAALQPLEEDLATLLEHGQDNADPKAAGRCHALLCLWPALWTFREVAAVEPTNNRAERVLRPAVLWRKNSYGTRSDAGARFVERLLTVTATCKQQGRSALAYLTDVCTATQYGQAVPSLLAA